MSVKTVVILSNHSLFAEGIARRLQQFPQQIEVCLVNPFDADAAARIHQCAPSAVITDAHDPEALQLCSLSELMFSNPALKILRLNSQQDTIQVVSSENLPVGKIEDLVDILKA